MLHSSPFTHHLSATSAGTNLVQVDQAACLNPIKCCTMAATSEVKPLHNHSWDAQQCLILSISGTATQTVGLSLQLSQDKSNTGCLKEVSRGSRSAVSEGVSSFKDWHYPPGVVWSGTQGEADFAHNPLQKQ